MVLKMSGFMDRLDRGEVPVVLALLERNVREVGFTYNLREHRV